MSLRKLLYRSLFYYWRTNVAVVLGASIGVAVITGSLLVGDSVRGSLRELALERLGRVDCALVSNTFFREDLALDLAHQAEFRNRFGLCVPAILLQGSARSASSEEVVPGVTVFGVHDDFWRLSSHTGPAPELANRKVVVNQALAADLGVAEGDALILNLARQSAAPVDTIFGRRSWQDAVLSPRVTVAERLPMEGLGRFSLRGGQSRPRNAFVSLDWLQRRLGQEYRANALFAASTAESTGRTGADTLNSLLETTATLEDYGLRVKWVAKSKCLSLESDRLVLRPSFVRAASRAASDAGVRAEPISVYLANSIAAVSDAEANAGIPYSLVAGLNPAMLSSLEVTGGAAWDGQLGADEMLVNSWAMKDLGLKIGDRVEAAYFVSAGRHGLETRSRRFRLRGAVAMEGLAADPGLVPEVKGVTDATTMRKWDPPFPVDLDRIRTVDEQYWKEHRTTPKAFVSAEAMRSMWQSGHSHEEADRNDSPQGWVTSVRLTPTDGESLESTAAAFSGKLAERLWPTDEGLTFLPVRAQALESAKGSTDFGVLFLSLSMFLVASAAALVGLLLRLSAERRASQTGILLATGFKPGAVSRVLLSEGLVLALLGTITGVPLGIGYAWLIMYALRTWWQDAVGPLSLWLHVGPTSLVVGAVSGLTLAAVAVWWSARALRRASPHVLLFGWRALRTEPEPHVRRAANRLATISLTAVVALLILAATPRAISPVIAFFLGGAVLLLGVLSLLCAQLVRQAPAPERRASHLSLWRLAWRGASLQWVRSLLTAGLLAGASFMIVAVAANRRDLSRLDTSRKDSGAGGFSLVARSDLPVYHDLNTQEGRDQLGFSAESSAALAGCRVIPFRLSDGDDASCLNIERPQAPRILGVTDEMIRRGGFGFSAVKSGTGSADRWELLSGEPGDGIVPAFGDANSVQWILHSGLGQEITVTDRNGRPLRLRFVGLLSGSIFASEILVSERNFVRHFGTDSGYRYFLIETPVGKEQEVVTALRKSLGDLGFDTARTADTLATFARVQNCYLGTFQTLGGLGLLLGTFGIVTVLLRNVLERRSELALMLSLGFRHSRLIGMVLLENGLLLLIGLGVGTVAALVAVAPQLAASHSDVQWGPLGVTLLSTLVLGLVSCTIAARAAVRGDLLSALRSE